MVLTKTITKIADESTAGRFYPIISTIPQIGNMIKYHKLCSEWVTDYNWLTEVSWLGNAYSITNSHCYLPTVDNLANNNMEFEAPNSQIKFVWCMKYSSYSEFTYICMSHHCFSHNYYTDPTKNIVVYFCMQVMLNSGLRPSLCKGWVAGPRREHDRI